MSVRVFVGPFVRCRTVYPRSIRSMAPPLSCSSVRPSALPFVCSSVPLCACPLVCPSARPLYHLSVTCDITDSLYQFLSRCFGKEKHVLNFPQPLIKVAHFSVAIFVPTNNEMNLKNASSALQAIRMCLFLLRGQK